MKKTQSGFQSDAADRIWNDHLGNNAYTRHRDQCPACLTAYETAGRSAPCPDGLRIFDELLADVYERVDEALVNHN